MTRSSEATRLRLLEAATEEFATHGLAGARVDRIALAAACNKQAIYAYFESKEGLAEAVFADVAQRLDAAVPFESEDLSGYAVRLFDYFRDHPDARRLLDWYALEGTLRTPSIDVPMTVKERQIAQSQKDGRVNQKFKPEVLLALVHAVARLSSSDRNEAKTAASSKDFRKVILDALSHVTTVAAK